MKRARVVAIGGGVLIAVGGLTAPAHALDRECLRYPTPRWCQDHDVFPYDPIDDVDPLPGPTLPPYQPPVQPPAPPTTTPPRLQVPDPDQPPPCPRYRQPCKFVQYVR